MSQFFEFYHANSLRLTETLLHFLWQGTVIGASAYLLERLMFRASARSRYAIHVVALVMMAICLPLTFTCLESNSRDGDYSEHMSSSKTAIPNNTTRLNLRLHTDTSVDFNANSTNAADSIVTEPVPAPSTTVDSDRTVETDAATSPPPPDSVENATTESLWPPPIANTIYTKVSPYIVVGYLICVVTMLVRLAGALGGGRRLRMLSKTVTDAHVTQSLSRQAKSLGLRMAPAIAYCEQVSIPIVVGILRPTILLPASLATGLSHQQLEAVIAHELAHLRYYDQIINMVQRVIEAIAFFHPAVWYVSSRIDVQREHAADDLVLASGWQRIQYADALVHTAELSRQIRVEQSKLALAASGNNETEFKRRIMRLVHGTNTHVRLSPTGFALYLFAIGFITITPFVVQSWAQSVTEEADSPDKDQIGRRIDDFVLRDFRGRSHSLNATNKKLVVVAFLGTECPLAKLYGKRLHEISTRYSKDVAFIGICSNQQDTPTELAHYARQHGIEFPLLKDAGNRVADLFQAERTPEVFLLDKTRRVRYWGRIDDQFGVGYGKPSAHKHFLDDAINDLLAGRSVKVARTESVGCYIGRVHRDAPRGEITYTTHIAPIMQSRCVECHRTDGIAPFGLENYDDVAAWSETIAEVVMDQRMPPWHADPKYGHFSNDATMPKEEKQLLTQWVQNGVPRGEGPPISKRDFPEGWLLGKPDKVLKMPSPIDVPATGIIDYQYVEIDPGFTEGKWVRASEIRPGVRSVVHHVIVFINPPGGDPILEERGIGFETVGGYVPGSAPMQLAPGVARYIPPGSTLVLQLHYTPDGTARQDQTQIGLYFADQESIRHTMQTGVVANLDFEIPAGASDHRITAQHRFSHDMEIHTLVPHMHFRGKSFRFEAIYPHGAREILLDVPRYDFNWQHAYQLNRPKLMPEGTLLKCTAVFDNSADNLSNPDPTTSVRWGEQTWEEMMLGYFDGVFMNQNMSIPEPKVVATDDGDFKVHFKFKPDRTANSIHLAGTFNDWNLFANPLSDPDGDGIYTTDIKVKPGEYRYKFVIDGNYWTHDPASKILTGFLHESFFVAGEQQAAKGGAK